MAAAPLHHAAQRCMVWPGAAAMACVGGRERGRAATSDLAAAANCPPQRGHPLRPRRHAPDSPLPSAAPGTPAPTRLHEAGADLVADVAQGAGRVVHEHLRQGGWAQRGLRRLPASGQLKRNFPPPHRPACRSSCCARCPRCAALSAGRGQCLTVLLRPLRPMSLSLRAGGGRGGGAALLASRAGSAKNAVTAGPNQMPPTQRFRPAHVSKYCSRGGGGGRRGGRAQQPLKRSQKAPATPQHRGSTLFAVLRSQVGPQTAAAPSARQDSARRAPPG